MIIAATTALATGASAQTSQSIHNEALNDAVAGALKSAIKAANGKVMPCTGL
jgi:hypothetical protein